MSDPNVRLQNLRDFTVKIRRLSNEEIIGTGIVVSMDGKIVTCAHVVEMAGVDPRVPGGGEVGVYFPQIRGGERKQRRATIVASFPQHDDDVVLLQLLNGPTPLEPEQIAVLGTADLSEGNSFRSFGYCPLGPFPSSRAAGTIMGSVDSPVGRSVQADPVQLKSSEIAPGMSGAAVLDEKRNLVVGLISETWFPDASTKHRDAAWAINACVLTLDPLNLPVRETALPKRAALQPRADAEAARAAVAQKERIAWNNAPVPVEGWVGRDDLLKALNTDRADPDHLLTGLIGFGGEGKSSLARRWVDELLADSSQPKPDGVFWWGFYTKPSVDEFLEAALSYLGGGSIDPHRYPSSTAKAHLIAAMLHAGCYLFVLDGLEVLQHQGGDQYGLLQSADLREFLSYFAAPGHQSFCLITSRAPILDLMDYVTYTHRDVTRLSPDDGRNLLRTVGVTGTDTALNRAVADWDGHALTLSLLGAYLVEQHGGDVSRLADLLPPVAGEPRYQRIHHVLRRYDDYLTEAERAFLILFSAFRTPVEEPAFARVFRTEMGADALNAPIARLNDAAFAAMIEHLVAYRILRYDPHACYYTTHPLIQSHYLARLMTGNRNSVEGTHDRIKDYYLNLAGHTPRHPMLDDLRPLLEVVHHACRTGAYNEAYDVWQQRIYQGKRKVLIHELGAAETALALLSDFFPGEDVFQEPQVSDSERQCIILSEVGLRRADVGYLGEAQSFYERSVAIALRINRPALASRVYQDLAELHAHLGNLSASMDSARRALELAQQAGSKWEERYSLSRQAWAAHLSGDLEAASAIFRKAEALEREISPSKPYLFSVRGTQHADHLRRTGNADYAARVTEANLRIGQRNRWAKTISKCHRILGDLAVEHGEHKNVYVHHEAALLAARKVSKRDTLIEALLAQGRWAIRYQDLTDLEDPLALALGDLNEALDYALDGGYRIYEADIRIALAWAHLAASDPTTARAEAQRAQQMSEQMRYYWGQVDADEVLAAICAASNGDASDARQSKRYQTQWAAQFYVAAELTRRGYLVSLTLGNAPGADLLVVSPMGKHFEVDVKGLSSRTFWLIQRREPSDELFFVLVYLPKNHQPPQFYIVSSEELMGKRDEYRQHIETTGGSYREDLGGINWGTALDYQDRWDTLPK
jgi:tetratricopeptide (TPR) repeat protein